MSHPSPDPARKRYYIVSVDIASDSGSGASFVNADQALVNGRRVGHHERRIPGREHPVFVGVPELRTKPRVVFPGTGARAEDYSGSGPVFISSRAKKLLEECDPDAFEFAECDTATRLRIPIRPYWWMSVVRWVEKFDEDRSVFKWYRDSSPGAPDAQSNPMMTALYDVHLPAGFPDEYRAFRFAHYNPFPIFDEVIVDAWRKARMTGARFTPLQPPTPADLKATFSYDNEVYWREKAGSR